MATTRPGVTAAVAALLAGGLLVAPAPSGAAPASDPTTVARKLVSPLSMAVAGDGTAYVSQNFAGLLTAVPAGGSPEVVFAAPRKTEVGAVSVGGGLVRFATTAKKHAALWSMRPGASPTEVADLYRYEKTRNPDADQAYGFTDLDPTCLAQVPPAVPASYAGLVDSHPYGTAVRRGTTYVADAGANAILAVSPRGKVSTVAVLPTVPVVITAEAAAANELPACTVGHAYAFEPVPTDVEVGRGGWLYVSLLPGGPEDGSAGANGMVVKVKARTGAVRTVASGFAGATGVAVARNGDVYVAQLFGGQVSRVRHGSSTAKPWATVKMPAAVEWVGGQVLVSANVLADGPKGKVLAY
ncbi:ScyD/ScyE family protein [Nocardioides okcheonensis]|uniref:ScyD/ScyE family protein n=1 Tax=Nocardioides okcheonensis TaxID=2894081 RepID=UPI001E2AF09C|nr:ScyD/ScyE family protein [Nocardioides okcheonensis]UFN43735.1 ScyD/ScyE family protein [Nocardioides okcheonensis]